MQAARDWRLRYGTAFVLVLALLLTMGMLGAHASTGPGVVGLKVLSNRADLISGGDALVEVTVPSGANVTGLHVDVNGRDVSSLFAVRPGGRVEGLLTGMVVGNSLVRARLVDGRGATIKISNHPQGGPVFSGPQIQPWTCMAGAVDAQCDRPPAYTYSYMSTSGGSLKAYDPKNPPSDVATTTTDTGATVPFIVRQETGSIDRDEYAIATLYDPSKPWQPWAPQAGFNHRLVITHGASCDTSYASGAAPAVTDSKALGHGYVLMSTALDNAGHNCNIITQAESLVMAKERVIEQYGELAFTIGSGCSGGSLVQQQVANAFPGLYQGITPQCSFTDAWSSAMQYVDYDMLLRYFKDPSRWDAGTTWTPVQISEVIGHPNIGNPITFTTAIPAGGDPSRSCPGLAASQVYDPTTNPKGVRCTLEDYMVNVFGRQPDGLAELPFDNAGIQYGLAGLRAGLVSPGQFVDLNTHIGSFDRNYEVQAPRYSATSTAIQRAYTSGAVDTTNNLDQVAIIDLRGPDPGAFHDVYRTYALRARLLRDHGTAANQVLWRGQVPLLGDANYVDEAIVAMDKWLTAVAADHSSLPLASKIIRDKPDSVGPRCTNGAGTDLPAAVCDETVQSYGTPRIAADMPLADDTLKCNLKPMVRANYPVSFTDDQWSRLQKAFPGGVCDYGQPGVGRHGAIPWMNYSNGPGTGHPMGPAPVSKAS
ncbi:MAG: hypothetical protein QOK05_2177 [Chloroflexota bacterium]|nr:hypothetical protein [Chloroflexota bacterium]